MAKIEKLFIQIFERKRWIIEHLNQQKELYDQHLLSKLLIQGITPPPWLLSPQFPSSTCSDLTELNKEELISGILLPRPGTLATYPSGPCFVYDRPVAKAANDDQRHETCTRTCASSTGFDANDPGIVPTCRVHQMEDELGVVHPSRVDGTEDMVNYVPMSPEDQTDLIVSSTYSKAEQSLARIQRSKSRQKALELRNSAKASAKCHLRKEDDAGKISETRSCREGQQLDGLRESLELVKSSTLSAEPCSKEEAAAGDCSDKGRSEAHCKKTSRSGHNEAEVQSLNHEKKKEKSNNYGEQNTSSRRCCPQFITEDYHNDRKSRKVDLGRITRSRSGNTRKPETSDPQNQRVTRSKSCNTQFINADHAIRSSEVYRGRITRSKSYGAKQAEKWDNGSRTKTDMSVKPKQLDFDEVEESCLSDFPAKGQDKPEEKTTLNVAECSASTPCAISTELFSEPHVESFACETLEIFDGEAVRLFPGSDRTSGKTSFMPDCLPNSQVTQECLLGNTVDHASDPNSSGPNADRMAEISSQKHTYEPDGASVGLADSRETQEHLLGNTVEYASDLNSSRPDADGGAASLSSQKHTFEHEGVSVSLADSQVSQEDIVGNTVANASSSRTGADGAAELSSQKQTFESKGSSIGLVGGSKLPELWAALNVLPEHNFRDANGSWPCYKRRRIGYELFNKSARPSVRVNPFVSKESIPRNSSAGGANNSSHILQKSITSQELNDMLSNVDFSAVETHQSGKCSLNKESGLTPEVKKGEVDLERSVMMPLTCEHKNSSTSYDSKWKTAEPSDCFSDEGELRADPESAILFKGLVCGDLECAADVADHNSGVKSTSTKIVVDPRQYFHEADEFTFSVGSPVIEQMDVCVSSADEIAPEFTSSIIAEKEDSEQSAAVKPIQGELPFMGDITEKMSLPGKLCRAASLSTPASPFPSSYKLHLTPGVYRSVPKGLLENIDLASNQLSHGSALEEKSYSDYYSFPGSRLNWDIGKPFISPVGEGLEEIKSKSGGSNKRVSGNPELVCFPIQEDPESSEEDAFVNNMADMSMKKMDSSLKRSSIREPLRDITEKNEGILDPTHEVERGSLESVNTEISVSEMHNEYTKKNETHHQSRQRKQGKENQSLSIAVNSIMKHSESCSIRHSKPKLSGKSSLRSRGQSLSEKDPRRSNLSRAQSLSEKEPRRNNIVSNVKSFVSLVQQKQAAAAVPARRDVKIKALEAAEAAKRLAEKRENERKQKKEALKLERARVEQENLKQMELKKKLKEEEKKKRDAENAAKKRHREEEERKETEKKRKRIEEARCHKKEAEDKIHAWKEESKCGTQDGREREKDSNNKLENQVDREAENISRKPLTEEVGTERIEADSAIPTIDNKTSTCSSDTGKVASIGVAEFSTPSCDKNNQPSSHTSQEQSYDISPYQCSDDEEEEEEELPNKKFIPTWASKSRVAMALSSLKQIDPDSIFPPGSFCSLEEVLLPRRLPQKQG